MKVLSLFDGMACGMLAFKKLGIDVESYDAYEIDKYAIKTATHNFPMIQEHGDVFKEDFTKYKDIDFLVGGSPCTYWSIAQKNNRETEASGLGWELFSQYVRALREAKPKYFIYENNKSMSPAIRKSISETFGFEDVYINSALVSAQNRQRLYWVGKRNEDGTYSKVNVEQPIDKGIFLKDILENGEDLTNNDKSFCLTSRYNGAVAWNTIERKQRIMVAIKVGALPKPNGELSTSQAFRIYSSDSKSISLSANGGGAGGKTGLYAIPTDYNKLNVGNSQTVEKSISKLYDKLGYVPEMFNAYNLQELKEKSPTLSTGSMATSSCAVDKFERVKDNKSQPVYEVKDGLITIKDKKYPIKLIDGYYIIRKLTVTECKRLQTVPEDYEFPVSDSQAYKMLGNGWTVDVISHLINSAISEE